MFLYIYFYSIKTERFEILANEIGSIFKFEYPSVYYKACQRQGNQILPADGKLWHHFNYIKKTLKEAKLLREKKPRSVLNILNAEDLEPINGE